MSTEKNKTVAIAIDSVCRDLKQKVRIGTPFESRVSITVQNGTPITLKNRFQLNGVTKHIKQASLDSTFRDFTEEVILWLSNHEFFVASIEVAFDGFEFFANPSICESSVRLTA